jgi:hypothetical protein
MYMEYHREADLGCGCTACNHNEYACMGVTTSQTEASALCVPGLGCD